VCDHCFYNRNVLTIYRYYPPTGTQRYLVYITKGDQKKSFWLWERTTKKQEWHGRPSITINQVWQTSDTGYNRRDIFSVIDVKTFAPVYHTASNPKTGREAFNYLVDKIVTADTVPDVMRKDFELNVSEPSFNWELDLETFPLLPIAVGKTFAINFYHPGSKSAPAYTLYKVTGTEKLPGVNGEQVDCFTLVTEYPNNSGSSTWWLTKTTHEVIKMVERYGPITRYKIKLATQE
jgi:hypothetical protein